MGRILAIDYGKKKCGIAVTDPLQIIANGLTTVVTKDLASFIDEYLKKETVEKIIIGHPLQNSGEESESLKFIKPFFKQISNKYPHLNVEWVDERFTSKLAFQTMIDGGLKKMDRRNKELIDKISATIILQSYLEQKKNH
ncbi:MAG: Holliday junction resolvase RuvX [Marinilabiliaceae bacterium]|nr:Holliday junction resolvase RuvX [Marinilabiliaceae bacterium]